jgi:threonine dehydrogenase-like Zn-dependent dehydrogenase
MEAMPPLDDARWSIPVLDFTQKMTSYRGAGGFTAFQFETSLELIGARQIDVGSLVTHTFPLEDFSEALGLATSHRDVAVKVVFDLSRDPGSRRGG